MYCFEFLQRDSSHTVDVGLENMVKRAGKIVGDHITTGVDDSSLPPSLTTVLNDLFSCQRGR
jgi:hypothetical protein